MKVVLEEGLLEDRKVVGRKTQHVAHLLRHLLGIEDHAVLDRLVVGEGHERVHPGKTVDEDAVGYIRGERDAVDIERLFFAELPVLPVQVPHAQEAVCHLSRIGGGFECFRNLVFVLLEDRDQFLPETVFFIDVVLVPFDLVFEILDPLAEQQILPQELFPALEAVLGGSGLDQAEEKRSGK